MAQGLGCRQVVTLGGFRQEEVTQTPQVYCAASDTETLKQMLGLGTKAMVGQIYGMAGITVGLAALRGFRGFSLLVETLGTFPDANAARFALVTLSKYLNLEFDLSKLDAAAEETRKILESFGLIQTFVQEKKKEEQPFRWFI
jgi:proteasome assembly chaperone (PAC2) family protein